MFSRKQKSFIRNFAFIVMLLCGLLGARAVQSAQAAALVVTNTNDSGAGSLRQAMIDAVSGDTITFDPALAGQTITLSSTLTIDKNLTINGSALVPQINISGNNTQRVFLVNPGVVAILNTLIIINGGSALNGGGIYNQGTLTVANSVFFGNSISGSGSAIANDQGALTVSGSRFTGNTAKNDGGAIFSSLGTLAIADSAFDNNNASRGGGVACSGGTMTVSGSVYLSNTAHGWSGSADGGAIYNTCNLTVTNSTFSVNTASLGGAILTDNDVDPTVVTNSTFHGNTAPTGGGIYNAGQLIVTNSTFSDNNSTDAGAIRNGLGGVLSLRNSILANTVGGVDCSASDAAPLAENINNLIETNGADLQSCGTPLLAADPLLGPLQHNGSFTQTMALLPGSPAIDAGDAASCPATDQRGVSRPQGSGCDIGAYEYIVLPTPTLTNTPTITPTVCGLTTVTNTNDSGPGSLRQTIADVCPGGIVYFAPSLAGQTITLGSNLIINKNVTIDGSGLSPQVTISGGNVAHLEIGSATYPNVTISGLTIANGYSSGNGGAIFASIITDLTVINSTLKNNHAIGDGGAIYSNGRLTLKNTTVSQNQADSEGGAFAFVGNVYGLDIVNSTVSQNQAGSRGGAIYTGGNVEAAIYNSTFAGNSAPQGSELQINGNTILSLANTIFICTTGSSNCYYHNPVTASIVYGSDSILGTGILSDYGLAELADNGGPTRTMALFPTSPLIDAGDDSICSNSYVNGLDQRGVIRPYGKHCDIGAYEADGTFVPTPTATSTPTATMTPSPTPTNTFTPTATPPYSYNPLYLSLTGSQTIGGVSSADEDILKFDGTNWSLFFDGSDVGVATPDLFAFSIMDADTILMSFSSNVTVNGIAATPQDILRFDATSLGSVTAGTWSLYFDGSDVGLSDTTNEKIDSLSLLPDGRLLISTNGNPVVPGVSGGRDEDVLAFTPTSLGSTTSGTWSLYFDGSDVGLSETSGEDVDALDVVGGNIYLSTQGDFSVPGLSGADEDVFICAATSLGDVTACNYSPSLYFDGSTWGLTANDVDAFNFLASGPTPTVVPTNAATATPTATFTVIPNATNTPTRTPTPTATSSFTSTPTATPTATSTGSSTFFTFLPLADAYVNAGSPASNYGSSTTLRVDASPDVRSYLRFNVLGLTGSLKSATILVYANSSSSSGINVNNLSDNTWTESTINYNNAPPIGGSLGSVGAFTAPIWIRVDVTSYVTGNGTYNFALTTPGSTAISLASREAGANAPQLIIETAP